MSGKKQQKNSSGIVKIAYAALLSPPFSTLSYLLPEGFSAGFWKEGLRLAVPLGRNLRSAVLLRTEEVDVASLKFALKELAWPLEHSSLISPSYLELAAQFALRQAMTTGRVLASMLPTGLKETDLTLRFFTPSGQADYLLREMPALSSSQRSDLAKLWEAGEGKVLKLQESLDDEVYSLKASPPWPVRPVAHKQLAVLDFLAARGQSSRRRLNAEFGVGVKTVLNILVQRGLVELGMGLAEDDAPSPTSLTKGEQECKEWQELYASVLASPPPFELNFEQQAALDDFNLQLMQGNGVARLLYGVTGSGKTAVYLELAAKALQSGRSVLILAPEVALALKLHANASERFPGLPVYLSHGYQTAKKREQLFRQLATSHAPSLVVGTRSALFLPLQNIGAIILDEEHDSSFKQDERVNYQAKDLAWYQMQKHGALLVLGSATPDLKTFYAVEQKQLTMHRLNERAGSGSLPEVTLSPMGKARGSSGVLTDESTAALQECVAAGQQAVILLNRRGYSPSMYCLSCGAVTRCPNCDIALSYHKGRERLVCHYCGYSLPFPSPCSACKHLNFLPMGEGTEKLEERLASILPTGTKVLRLDRDSTSRPGVMEEILQSFAKREASVLVGTQMLSKGHHFPHVTLAIVADGDLGLSMPDYNAAERTFQLVLQASGRSGRGEKPGRVIIQTRDAGHYCWDFIRRHDYEGFYAHELELRRKRRYPPFVKLALVRFSFPMDWPEGHRQVNRLGQVMQQHGMTLGVAVLGPAPAPHPLRDRRLRFQCLLKGSDWKSIRGVYSAVAAVVPHTSNLRISLDIDPASLL